MNIPGSAGVALLALMLSLSACSVDTMLGTKPKSNPPVEKATVDTAPAPAVKSEIVSPKPVLITPQSNQLQATVTETTAPEVKTSLSEPPVIRQESPVAPKIERTLSDTIPDLVFKNTVLAEDTVLRGVVHITGWVTAPPQVTLTVEAGTIIRFRAEEGANTGAGLLVQGRMVASGSSDKQILFTGPYDKPLDGDWQGIVLLATDKKNLLEQCRIEGAVVALDAYHSQATVRNLNASSCGTALRLRDSFATIAGGSVSSCGTGIQSIDSELELKDMNLSSNRNGMAVSGGGLYLSGSTFYSNSQTALVAENGKLKVTGCSFTVNGTGLSLRGTDGTVSYNKFLNNRDAGMVLTHARTRVNGNNISHNSVTGLRIAGGGSVIWGNVIASNNGHDLSYTGGEELPVMGNWWGETDLLRITSRLRSGDGGGRILFLPILVQRPDGISSK